MKSPELSVAVITKNEEDKLPDCLRSVSFASDIVVVDSGSDDRTVEIAKEFRARVFIEEWKGYGLQISSAVKKCRHEWVLILDADERIPNETKDEISRILQCPSADAYSFPRKNYLHGRWIRHCDWWPDRVIRLVRKDKGRYPPITHSRWITEGTLSNAQCPIEHFSFSDYSEMLGTLNNYSTSTAIELLNEGKRANLLSPLYHGLGMFLKIYILKLAFLDGLDGFVIALTKAGGALFKYAKLIELQRNRRKD